MAVAGVSIGTGWITIVPSMRGFGTALNKQLGGAEQQMEKSGKKSGTIFTGALTNVLGSFSTKAISAAAATVGKVFTLGMSRYTQIENSQAKLDALGKTTAEVDDIMKRATASVKGTAFGLGEAVDVAAQMTASMKDMKGERLEATLTTIANASAVAGTSMGEMGAIFSKAAASNKVQGDILAQLGDRGIPIVQWLADEVGVTAEAVYDMSRRGVIDFATFERAMANGMSSDAAVKMGNTLTGMWANTQAALGRLGEKVLSLFGPIFKRALGGAIKVIDSITGAVENFFSVFRGDDVEQRPQWLKDLTDKVAPAIETARETVAKFGETFKEIYGEIIDRIKEFAGSRASQFADTWKSLTNVFSGQMGNWTKAIDWVRKAIKWLWDLFGDNYITLVLGVWGVLSDAIKAVVGVLEGVVTSIGGILSGDWTQYWGGYKKVVGSIFDGIVDILWSAIETVAKLLGVDSGTLAKVKEKWDNFWGGIRNAVSRVTAWWEDKGRTAWDGMTSWWQKHATPRLESFRETVSEKWNDIRGSFAQVGKWWKEQGEKAWDGMTSWWQKHATPRIEEFRKNQADKWNDILESFAKIGEWWNRPGDGGKATWDSIVDRFRTFISPYIEDLKDQWDETWGEIQSAWQVVPDWWNRPGTGGKATWDDMVDLFNRTVKPAIEELERIWDKAWREIKDAAEPITDWWNRPDGGGKKMFKELAGKWTPDMTSVLKVLAAVIVGPVIAAFKALEFALKIVGTAATVFKSIWAAMEFFIIDPIKNGVNTAIDILNALIRGYNKIAVIVGIKEIGEIDKPSFGRNTQTYTPRTGGGQVPQFYDGGATPNVGKYTPAGIVHGDEHVWTSAEVNRFPGGHAGLYKLRALTMAKKLDGMIPGFFLGGHVPVPGGRVTNRHPHPYYSSRWAGDFAMPMGTPIYAWKDGQVAWIKRLATSYGNHLLLNHAANESSLYAHLSRFSVAAGQIVKAGQKIGEVGSTGNSTGPHLHFEIRGGNSPLGGDTGSIRDFFSELKAAFTGPLDRLKEIGNSPIGELIKAIPRKAADAMLEKVKSAAAVFHANLPGLPGASVERWRSHVVQALGMAGLPQTPAYIEAWLRQIQSESSGNPANVQSVRDINWPHNKAVGLVQLTPGTFAAYRHKGLPNDRTDPLANLFAGMNYAKNRYGIDRMLNVIGRGHGYWRGTDYARPGWALVGERGPELMKLRGGEQILSNTESRNAIGGDTHITYSPVLINEDPERQREDFAWWLVEEAGL